MRRRLLCSSLPVESSVVSTLLKIHMVRMTNCSVPLQVSMIEICFLFKFNLFVSIKNK